MSKVAAMEQLAVLDGPWIETYQSSLRDKSLRLDHVGIAVRSIASARTLYEILGISVTSEETVEHERVRTAMLSLGESRLELIEPMDEDSAIARFLTKRGEGIHHIALHSDDIDAKFGALQAMGMRLASNTVRVGAGGHRYFFVHPASAGGVLMEIVGDALQSAEPEPK